MEELKKELVKEIAGMTYTQFVGYINQWNVPPGSLATINEWAIFGHVNQRSKVLELACTTGFSGREMSRMTGCSVLGIDICKTSIESAKYCKEKYASDLDLHYINADACTYELTEKFSHVIIGASLGFFERPLTMLKRLSTFFWDTGYILASPYYTSIEIPKELINECQHIIGITPTMCSYETVRDLYQDFEIAYESRKVIEIESEAQMKRYTEDVINNCCKQKKITSNEVYDLLYKRLYEIKRVSNDLHKYQKYSVMVLRYFNKVYPNRFIELF